MKGAGQAASTGALSMVVALLTSFISSTGSGAGTLDDVKKRGTLRCGVSTGVPGFSVQESGRWVGLDVDFCRAISAAVLSDPEKVTFVPTTTSTRFEILSTGAVDVLSRNSTWTMSRDSALGLTFAAITFFDGQAFMVRAATGVRRVADLAGSTVCVQSGTTTELNLADYFAQHAIAHTVVTFLNVADAVRAYEAGRCDVFTTDRSGLFAQRSTLHNPREHIVLAEVISKEPLGPAVRQNDWQWFNVVKWTHFALLTAEELGVTSANIDDTLRSSNPDVRRLLGQEGDLGIAVGLTPDWVVRMVRAVGNYGESFDRNVGLNSALGIARERNALWTQGGLQYAPPIR